MILRRSLSFATHRTVVGQSRRPSSVRSLRGSLSCVDRRPSQRAATLLSCQPRRGDSDTDRPVAASASHRRRYFSSRGSVLALSSLREIVPMLPVLDDSLLRDDHQFRKPRRARRGVIATTAGGGGQSEDSTVVLCHGSERRRQQIQRRGRYRNR